MSAARTLLLAVAAALVAAGGAFAAERQPTEHEVKAVFLFHFTRFVEWPAEAWTSRDQPFAVCVLGDDPFGPLLDEAMRGEQAAGRPVVVRRVATPAAAAGCQIVFQSAGGDPRAAAEVPGARSGLVLVVGESPEQLAHGALVRFVVQGTRVRLEVSAPALARTRLVISSKLLRLTDRVEPPAAR